MRKQTTFVAIGTLRVNPIFQLAMDPFGSTLFVKQDINVSMEIDAGNISLKKEHVINLSFVQKTDLSINFKDITSELRNV